MGNVDKDISKAIAKGVAQELNKEVATLLGWTTIVSTGGALLGKPASGSPNSRDQAMVPNWAGDLTAASRLMILTQSYIDKSHIRAEVYLSTQGGYFIDDEQAYCMAVTRSVMNQLKIGSPRQ